MNASSMISMLMRSNMPQKVMRNMGLRKTRKPSMTYSLIGLAASAAAAYALRNKSGKMMRAFQHQNMNIHQPVAAGLTEFAKEFVTGMNGMKPHAEKNSHPVPASATSSYSNELISQIGSTAKASGNEQKLEELTEKLIDSNLKTR